MGDRYDDERRPEHSSRGDALQRYGRDPDAFTAGVQYALDTMLARQAWVGTNVWGGAMANTAADILRQVHDGVL